MSENEYQWWFARSTKVPFASDHRISEGQSIDWLYIDPLDTEEAKKFLKDQENQHNG